MKNIDKKIFDYLTIKENFESSIELVESLQKVQTELIKYFWLDVVEAIKNNFSNENNLINKSWLFEYEIFEDGRGIELLVRHLNDTNGSCYYIVNIDIRIGGKAKMGVYIDNFVIQELDPRKLDIDEKKLSDDGWYADCAGD